MATYKIYELWASWFQRRRFFKVFSHYKSMGAICYHSKRVPFLSARNCVDGKWCRTIAILNISLGELMIQKHYVLFKPFVCWYSLLSLDQDQDRWNRSWSDPNCLTLWWYSWKNFLKKLIFDKNQQTTKNMQNFPAFRELTHLPHRDVF